MRRHFLGGLIAMLAAVCGPVAMQAGTAGVPPKAPAAQFVAPPFDPASPEARAAGRLDHWRAAMASPRAIGAPSWILMDLTSGRVLAQHNAEAKMYPASTTKMLMALTALNAVGDKGLDRVVTIGPNPPKTGEQSLHLLQGERFTLRDLLRGALIKSANDACVAVAEGVAGTVPAFVHLMNDEARRVGAVHSHFANPHGLHDPNHYTTAHDLALIARAALRYPFIAATVNTRDAAIHGSPQIPGDRALVNRNRLLWRWANCDGVKTGYTRQAGRCLVATATRTVPVDGRPVPFRLLSVVLHAPDSWSDSAQLLQHQGFEKFRPVLVARAGQAFGPVAVKGGATEAEAIAPRRGILAVRRNGGADPLVQVQPALLRAPVKRGQKVGVLLLSEHGHVVARLPLVAREAVARAEGPLLVRAVRGAGLGTLLARLGLLCCCALGALFVFKQRRAPRRRPRARKFYEETISHSNHANQPTETRDQFLRRVGRTAGEPDGGLRERGRNRAEVALGERKSRAEDSS
jgi:D-alanyl-D-alanine carboxypeptidase (penicillin-binding protein 5/6)